MANKKYYWLRLQRDFFKRHDIKVIEAMPNGKDYILFYLKLLVESIDHEGELRFSETIPYSEEMLSAVTDTNIDVVRTALDVFERLGMIDILDDETIFMSEVSSMIGSTSDDDQREQWRVRQQRHRDKLKLENVTSRDNHVTSSLEIEKEIDIDIEKDIEKEITIDNKKSSKKRISKSYLDNPEVDRAFKDFIDMRKSIKKPMTDRAITMALNNLHKLAHDDSELAIKIIEQSIFHNWQDFYELKEDCNKKRAVNSPIAESWADA